MIGQFIPMPSHKSKAACPNALVLWLSWKTAFKLSEIAVSFGSDTQPVCLSKANPSIPPLSDVVMIGFFAVNPPTLGGLEILDPI